MSKAVAAGGGQAVIEYIEGFDSEPLRRVLYIASKQVLAPADFQNKRLDDLITVSDSGVAEMLRQAEGAPDEESRRPMHPGSAHRELQPGRRASRLLAR